MHSLPESALLIGEKLLFGFMWYGSLRLLHEIVFYLIVRRSTQVDSAVIAQARALATLLNIMLLFQLLHEYRSAPMAKEPGRLTSVSLMFEKHFRRFLLPASMDRLYTEAKHYMAISSSGNSSHFTRQYRVVAWQHFRLEVALFEARNCATFAGSSTGAYISASIANVSWLWRFPTFIASVLIALVALVLFSRYDISLVYGLIRVQPSRDDRRGAEIVHGRAPDYLRQSYAHQRMIRTPNTPRINEN